jgi:hypothetical protein
VLVQRGCTPHIICHMGLCGLLTGRGRFYGHSKPSQEGRPIPIKLYRLFRMNFAHYCVQLSISSLGEMNERLGSIDSFNAET